MSKHLCFSNHTAMLCLRSSSKTIKLLLSPLTAAFRLPSTFTHPLTRLFPPYSASACAPSLSSSSRMSGRDFFLFTDVVAEEEEEDDDVRATVGGGEKREAAEAGRDGGSGNDSGLM